MSRTPASYTCNVAVPATLLGVVAVMVTSPVLKGVTRPLASTLAVSGSLLTQLNVALSTTTLDASKAVGVNSCVSPTLAAATPGVTVTEATTCGAGVVLSLHVPKLLRLGALHVLV